MAPDPDRVLDLFLGFWVSRGVMAAVELGVFDLLEGRALSLPEAARDLGLADRPARALLDTCVAVGLLDLVKGKYRNSSLSSSLLTSSSEYSLRNYVLDERWCWPAWERLTDALRANAPSLPQDAEGYHTFPEEFLLDFLHGHSLAMGERLAAAVDLSGARRLMDVGGGSGAVSIALCRANPGLRTVVVDRPEVLRKAAEHVEAAGLAARIEMHPANVFSDPLPPGCDAAVLANVLHDFSPERARRILARVFEALPPGGRLAIMEIAPDEDRTGPVLSVAFSLAMLVNTEGGDAYTARRYAAWLEKAGFADVSVRALGGRMVTAAITARRP